MFAGVDQGRRWRQQRVGKPQPHVQQSSNPYVLPWVVRNVVFLTRFLCVCCVYVVVLQCGIIFHLIERLIVPRPTGPLASPKTHGTAGVVGIGLFPFSERILFVSLPFRCRYALLGYRPTSFFFFGRFRQELLWLGFSFRARMSQH